MRNLKKEILKQTIYVYPIRRWFITVKNKNAVHADLGQNRDTNESLRFSRPFALVGLTVKIYIKKYC